MIIAQCLSAARSLTRRVPSHVAKAARSREIDLQPYTGTDMPDAQWITCREAVAHTDVGFEDLMFLTLAVRANHYVGDARLQKDSNPIGGQRVTPGAFFVVDPKEWNWLSANMDKPSGFVALQWEVPRTHARRKAVQLIDMLDGTWRPGEEIDKRYRRWAP